MALLASHLEQIELCASTILDLPFPESGIFTNALLQPSDITTLIRDPDAHESALFSVVSAQELGAIIGQNDPQLSRTSVNGLDDAGLDSSDPFKTPRRQPAVAAMLGKDMTGRTRRQGTRDLLWPRRRTGVPNNEVDVELLLRGAEKLCETYPLAGVSDRIAALRARHEKAMKSIARFEELTAEQSEHISKLSGSNKYAAQDMDDEEDQIERGGSVRAQPFNEYDIKREEDMVKELERRKQVLEERVDGMKKDIGGILR